MPQKIDALGRRRAAEIFTHESAHRPVVLALAVRVHVVAAVHAANIAVELRADVIQLMENRDQFFPERMVEKPRQIEGEDVEHLAVAVVETLERPAATAAARQERAVLKPHRRELGLQAMRDAAAGLGESDRHLVDADVTKVVQSLRHIVAQRPHRPCEIESLRHAHPAREFLLRSRRFFSSSAVRRLPRHFGPKAVQLPTPL